MELLESRRIADNQKTRLRERLQSRRVVVVVDASIELKLTALRYALENFVRPADKLSLLGILHPCCCSVDDEQKGDHGPKFDGNVKNVVTEAIWKKYVEFHKIITEKEIYPLVLLKQVIFEIQIATGPDRKLVMAKQAVDLQGSWVILDKDLRRDKAYLMKQLNCNIVLMKSRSEATIIKLELHEEENPNVLEWKKRWRTAVGTARALRDLHEEYGVGCTVHRDADNTAVSYDVLPLVGAFAQATSSQSSQSSQPSSDESRETRCIGMRGYLAPEYAEYGRITDKADVYSFGVLLLQLVSGRKAIDFARADGEKSVIELVRPLIEAGDKQLDIVDPHLRRFCDVAQVKKMVDVAARCISIDPSQRPNISEVLSILERDNNLSMAIGDILHDPSTTSTKCLLQTNLITFQTNFLTLQPRDLDSVSSKEGVASSNVSASSNLTVSSSVTTHPGSQSHGPRLRDLPGLRRMILSIWNSKKQTRRRLTYSEMLD